MKTTESLTEGKLLRTMYPDVYDYLIEKLASYNIHSFDVQIIGRKVDSTVEITVRFGEGFARELTRTFSEKSLREAGHSFDEFCEEVQKTCKETLIADYYKMLKP